MRRLRRARRPLIALVALVLALAIGYLVREARQDDRSAPAVVRVDDLVHPARADRPARVASATAGE